MSAEAMDKAEDEGYLRKSIRIVNHYAFYILLLAFCGIGIHVRWPGLNNLTQANVFSIQVIFYAIISFFFYLVIYARIVEIISNNPTESWVNLFKIYGLNYFIFSMISMTIYILIFISFKLYFSYFKISPWTIGLAIILCNNLIKCLLIYVLPLIFLRKKLLYSIFKGIINLYQIFWKSFPLILLIFLKPLVTILINFIYHPVTILAMIGTGFFHNIVFIYLDLLVFTAATIILVKQEKEIRILP
jgi:hypothetical protein